MVYIQDTVDFDFGKYKRYMEIIIHLLLPEMAIDHGSKQVLSPMRLLVHMEVIITVVATVNQIYARFKLCTLHHQNLVNSYS